MLRKPGLGIGISPECLIPFSKQSRLTLKRANVTDQRRGAVRVYLVKTWATSLKRFGNRFMTNILLSSARISFIPGLFSYGLMPFSPPP